MTQTTQITKYCSVHVVEGTLLNKHGNTTLFSTIPSLKKKIRWAQSWETLMGQCQRKVKKVRAYTFCCAGHLGLVSTRTQLSISTAEGDWLSRSLQTLQVFKKWVLQCPIIATVIKATAILKCLEYFDELRSLWNNYLCKFPIFSDSNVDSFFFFP